MKTSACQCTGSEMDSVVTFVQYIRNLFAPLPRKRCAPDSFDSNSMPKKFPRLSSHHLPEPEGFLDLTNQRRSSLYKSPNRKMNNDVIVLDDDDHLTSSVNKSKFTSTPTDPKSNKPFVINGDDDDVSFVGETKLDASHMTSKNGRSLYSTPLLDLTGDFPKMMSQNGALSKNNSNNLSTSRLSGRSLHNLTDSNEIYRLGDKRAYQKILANYSNPSSFCNAPISEFLETPSLSRSAKMVNMCRGTYKNGNGKLTTRDIIKKVVDEPVTVRDSDSDSDVIILAPSPEPDIKVTPVNSLKKIVDTTQETQNKWLQGTIENHRKKIEERAQQIKEYMKSAEQHNRINQDIRMRLLASKINRTLQIKDVVLPVEEVVETELPPLTEEHLRIVHRAFHGDPQEVLSSKFNLNITRRDMLTLSGLQWLNDEVINFYMNLIIERGKAKHLPNAYAMNTFFYSKLVKDGAASLRRWTRRIDLFTYDVVCIPIHLGMHWCMAIIDFRDKSIRYYDSMGGSNNKCLHALRGYLEAEHLDKKKSEYDTSDFTLENVKDIPQQMNGSDCGMFSCTFAEFVSRNAKFTFDQQNMPYFRNKMVVEIIKGELLIQE